MATTALLSTVVMSALLLVVVAVMLRARAWQHPRPSVAVEPGELTSRVNGPLGWSVAFFLGTFLVMGLGIVYASGQPVAGVEPAALGVAVAGSLAVVLGVAAVVAIFGAGKSRGLNSAQAAGLASVLLATLVLVAIVVQLFVGG